MENIEGERRFKTEDEITNKLGFRPIFLKYQSLIQAILLDWRRTITSEDEEGEEEEDDYKMIDKILDNKSPAKIIYNCLDWLMPPQAVKSPWIR